MVERRLHTVRLSVTTSLPTPVSVLVGEPRANGASRPYCVHT
jgi:hypothetical protein